MSLRETISSPSRRVNDPFPYTPQSQAPSLDMLSSAIVPNAIETNVSLPTSAHSSHRFNCGDGLRATKYLSRGRSRRSGHTHHAVHLVCSAAGACFEDEEALIKYTVLAAQFAGLDVRLGSMLVQQNCDEAGVPESRPDFIL